jgi:hypothetical protein
VVQLPEPELIDKQFPLMAAMVEGFGFESDVLSQFADQSHIFELQLGPSSGLKIPSNHPIAVELKNSAFGKAAQECVSQEFRIHAGQFGQADGLGHRVDGLGDNELVGQFGDLAGSWWAEVSDPFPDGLKDG